MRAILLLVTVAFASIPAWADRAVPRSPGLDPPSLCDALAGNLVVNCGFESGSLGTWTVSGNSGFTGVGTFSGPGGVGPNTGDDYAYLGAVGEDGFITQSIATTAGQAYDFTFFVASDGNTPNDFTAIFGGDTLYSATGLPASKYVERQFLVTASSSSTVIEFDSRDDSGFLSLDDVSVVPAAAAVPEPRFYGIALLLLAVAGAVISKRYKRRVMQNSSGVTQIDSGRLTVIASRAEPSSRFKSAPTSGREVETGGTRRDNAESSLDAIPKVLDFLLQGLPAH